MVGMRSVVVDKLASVTQACGLSHEVRVAAADPGRGGRGGRGRGAEQQVHLQHPRAHQRPHGQGRQGRHRRRRARAPQGAVRLFRPRARVAAAGRHHPDAQHRRRARHLRFHQSGQGQALRLPRARGRAATSRTWASASACRRGSGRSASTPTRALDTRGVPVVALAGTCMEAGKTAAACAIISRMRHRGLTVDAFKATGVSLRRDILAMEDAGARHCAIFTDLGIVTTTRANGPALTRTMLTELAAGKPDVIVFELGDGILGTYGVDAILECPDIRAALTGVILSANDPVAAWGGVKLLRERFGIEPCVVTGPSTDNQVGVEIITSQMGVPAFNAMSNGAALGDRVIEAVGLEGRGAAVSEQIPAVVLGGTGYVAGELLRLIAGHPRFALAAVLSDSQPGDPLAGAFPHLASAYADTRFSSQAQVQKILCESPQAARVLRRAPRRLGRAHRCAAERRGAGRDAAARGRYLGGLPLPLPPRPTRRCTATPTRRPGGWTSSAARCRSTCAKLTTPHVGHPGCFATAILLASVPLLANGLIEPSLFVSGVTGSTGSGRKPIRGHPSSAAPRGPLQLQRAGAPPRARSDRLRAGRHGRGGAVRLRAALRPVRARHPRDAAGGAQAPARHREAAGGSCGRTTRTRRSCASRARPRA